MNGSTNRVLTDRYNACMTRMSGPLSTLVGSHCVYDQWTHLPGWETGKTEEELIEQVREALEDAEIDGVEFYKSLITFENNTIQRKFVKCKAKDVPVVVHSGILFIGTDINELISIGSNIIFTIMALHIETLGIKLPNKLLKSYLNFYSIPLVHVTNGALRLNIHIIKCIGKVGDYDSTAIIDELPTTELIIDTFL